MADERRSTVLMQARIPREIADHVASDAMVLGLDGFRTPSAKAVGCCIVVPN